MSIATQNEAHMIDGRELVIEYFIDSLFTTCVWIDGVKSTDFYEDHELVRTLMKKAGWRECANPHECMSGFLVQAFPEQDVSMFIKADETKRQYCQPVCKQNAAAHRRYDRMVSANYLARMMSGVEAMNE